MADLDRQLIRTSRTFALAIPELPEPTRREVEVAYLLFRVADTFEDATLWPVERQADALQTFEQLLDPETAADAEAHARTWLEDPPVDHDAYVELLGETAGVLQALADLRPRAQVIIRYHVSRTARGMARYAQRAGGLALETMEDLRNYCYVVAGIVGEMLTELFVLDRSELATAAPYLMKRARWFGEGLQLTNIVKDAADDEGEGRSFLPKEGRREDVFALAREDLHLAGQYVARLEQAGAPRGVVAFSAVPVLLAWGTLERVEAQGPGAKLTRDEVSEIVAGVHRALDAGEPVLSGRDPGA